MWNSPFEFPDLHLGCVAGSVIRPAPRLKAWGVKKTPVNIRFSGANNTVLFFVGAVELVLAYGPRRCRFNLLFVFFRPL